MENEDSSDESGELTYRKLDVPIITSEALEPVVTLFLSAITDDQWVLLAADHIDFDTFTRLYDMCHEVTNVITTWILDVVEPQIQNWMSTAAAQDRNMRHRDYYSLTEDNVKASIGNSFDRCFGEVTGFPQERSNESIILLELIAAEVKKRVNQSLAGLISSAGQSASCPQIQSTESNESYDSDTTQMVYQAGSILMFLLRKDTESSKDQEILPVHHPCAVTKGTEEEKMENEKSGKNRSFGHKVRTFFNRNTRKVIPACDLNTSVSHSSAEDATITRPVPNMQRSDSEDTVINSSSELLNNSPPKNRSFGHKLRTFFSSKTSKVTPGSDLNTSEDQGSLCRVSRNTSCPDEITEVEEFCSEDSVTPTCDKQSAIMRILSSTGKILMKPFTCCVSAE